MDFADCGIPDMLFKDWFKVKIHLCLSVTTKKIKFGCAIYCNLESFQVEENSSVER